MSDNGSSAMSMTIGQAVHAATGLGYALGQRAYLGGAYLRGAYLTGADLTGAYLTGADLTGAYLRGAYLTGAYLRGAYLTGADLTGAYLGGADLGGADLYGADLTGAYLRGAYLGGADGILSVGPLGDGYLIYAIRCDDGPRLYAGCRGPFTLTEARAWWQRYLDAGDRGPHAKQMLAGVDAIDALARAKGWEVAR